MSRLNTAGILQRFEAAQTEANKANIKRYRQLLGSIKQLGVQTKQTYGKAFKNIAKLGQSARGRVEQGGTRALAESEQDLINRGLGNTSIRETARRGIRSDVEQNQLAIDEQVGAQRSNLFQNRAGMEFVSISCAVDAIEQRSRRLLLLIGPIV